MDITNTWVLLLVIWSKMLTFDTYILRLPCTYQANFSVQHIDKYLVSSNPIQLYNISPKDCLLHCVQELTCISINHRIDNSECELLTEGQTQLDSRVGWKYYATEPWELLFGEACKTLNPCGSSKKCEEICDEPYYKCIELENIAYKKKAIPGSGTTFKGDRPASNCIDGILSSICESSYLYDQKLKINLGKSYRIIYIVITADLTKLINYYGIFIGNNEVPKKNTWFASVYQTTTTKRYDNNRRVYIGKYIWIQRNKLQKIRLQLREIQVFGIGSNN